MATPAKRSTTKRSSSKGSGLPENHTASEAVAYAIAEEYNDLKPSVDRIMNADLSESGKLHAITLFRDSLGVPGDPNRNPATAIEAAIVLDGDRPTE